MRTGHELFVYELADILDGERRLLDALQELENDSTNPQLRRAFADHRAETEGHAERVEECLALLGEDPKETECAGIKGLVEERDTFVEEEDPSDDILDLFQVGAGMKAETYEICAYEALIRMAREMKLAKVAQLLNENLKEEQAALERLERLGRKLKPEELVTEEQEMKTVQSSSPKRKRAA